MRCLIPAAVFLLAPPWAVAENASAPSPLASASEAIATEKITEPRLLSVDLAGRFPKLELQEGHEGWVQLELMVDSQGKPFDITVTNSTGDTAFERAAVDAMQTAKLQPGTLNGLPVESVAKMVVKFHNGSYTEGSSNDFFYAYKRFQKATIAKDRPAADAALKSLVVQSLYDDAYYGLALDLYARNWGSQDDQLQGLRRAIAEQAEFSFLKGPEYQGVLLECIRLEVNLHQYSEALKDWDALLKSGPDSQLTGPIKPSIDQIKALRDDAAPYDVTGTLKEDGQWSLSLYKSHFRVNVTAGHVSLISLLCKKGHVRFDYDPELIYTVPAQDGNCDIVLDGDAGSRITLTQS